LQLTDTFIFNSASDVSTDYKTGINWHQLASVNQAQTEDGKFLENFLIIDEAFVHCRLTNGIHTFF
jgi:hypothetical protein